MSKTILALSVCGVAGFLIGSATSTKSAAQEQQISTPSGSSAKADVKDQKGDVKEQPAIGRYQLHLNPTGLGARIFDTTTGKYVEQRPVRGDMTWVEVDPIGQKVPARD